MNIYRCVFTDQKYLKHIVMKKRFSSLQEINYYLIKNTDSNKNIFIS